MAELTAREGDAGRFLDAVRGAEDFLKSYETTAPLVALSFDDGQEGSIDGLDQLPWALFNVITYFFELPHSGWVHAVVAVHGEARTFDVRMAIEGLDGPLVVQFADYSLLTAQLPEGDLDHGRSASRWDAGVQLGLVQRRLEEVVTLIAELQVLVPGDLDDRRTAEALLRMLGELAATSSPPRGVVGESLRWVMNKLDIFVDEAAKTGGKIAGALVVGATGYGLSRLAPDLATRIRELIELAEGR